METFIRWAKFNLVGVLGMGVQLATLAIFNRLLRGHYLLATAAALETTLLHNFLWHLRYTWRDRPGTIAWPRQLLRFHLANGLVSLAGNLAFTRLLIHRAHLPLLAANAVAIVCCSAANFLLSHRWAFAQTRTHASAALALAAVMLSAPQAHSQQATLELPPDAPLPQHPPQAAPHPAAFDDVWPTYAGLFCGAGASTSQIALKPTIGCGAGFTFFPGLPLSPKSASWPRRRTAVISPATSASTPASRSPASLLVFSRSPSSVTAVCSKQAMPSSTVLLWFYLAPTATRATSAGFASSSATTGPLPILTSTTSCFVTVGSPAKLIETTSSTARLPHPGEEPCSVHDIHVFPAFSPARLLLAARARSILRSVSVVAARTPEIIETTVTRYTRQDVLRILHLQPRQLTAWEREGLIAPVSEAQGADGHTHTSHHYTFEHLSRLRALREMRSKRLSARSIRAQVEAIERLAGMRSALSETSAVRYGARLSFRHGGALVDALTQQLHFDFATSEVRRLKVVGPGGPREQNAPDASAEAAAELQNMFIRAVQLEESPSTLDDAIRLYDAILLKKHDHAPACINLGTIFYNRRDFPSAERMYRRATEVDPAYALAFFDLGNVLDEMQRLPDAIDAYQRAIQIVPAYADAHYNLALAYERQSERRRALRHWMTYVRLDPVGPWAAHATSQSRKILAMEKLSIVSRGGRRVSA